jgi:hypothetical protein
MTYRVHHSGASTVSAGGTMKSGPSLLELRRIAMGFTPSMAVSVLVRLGIPDLLASGPRTASDLARQCDANEDFLHRVLRYLASEGILDRVGDRFALTSLSNWLRTDVSGSLSFSVVLD